MMRICASAVCVPSEAVIVRGTCDARYVIRAYRLVPVCVTVKTPSSGPLKLN